MTSKLKQKRHGADVEFGDHDDDSYVGHDGSKTAYLYNASIHGSGSGQRRQLST
ncbi:hypothetical protein DY000_02015156 [Brassica cretica]|uniref:Uncharacterized protein n=1 Tax=Brassica cretica TaxID=69181 RepID=A0ABQ7D023_BRACR|nr:hypothetical protein DY000_02015156 [Brassica cretica]